MSIVKILNESGKINYPENIDYPFYEVIGGSKSYGIISNSSDYDIIGVVIPPKEQIYHHLTGMVPGFGPEPSKFKNFVAHHIGEYDINLVEIVKFFNLCAENNPNMLEILFIEESLIMVNSDQSALIRENRLDFLNKNAYFKFTGYAKSQRNKLKNRANSEHRKELYEKYGYDTKFAYHMIRLSLQAIQILQDGDLNLNTNSELLNKIRNGGFSLLEIEEMFDSLYADVELHFNKSTIPESPDYKKLNKLLKNVLESYYEENI